jgi:molybdate transport repressor ModE-like protein
LYKYHESKEFRRQRSTSGNFDASNRRAKHLPARRMRPLSIAKVRMRHRANTRRAAASGNATVGGRSQLQNSKEKVICSIEPYIKLPRGVLTPKIIRFLDCVFQKRLCQAGALSEGISYPHAWQLIRKVENIVGEPVVETLPGGFTGGGSQPSKAGLMLLQSCRRIDALANGAVKRQLKQLSFLAGNSPQVG